MSTERQKEQDLSQRERSPTVRTAEGTAFFLLGAEKGVFCEPLQQIYTLNDTAAFIWCGLEEGKSRGTICQELAALGLDPEAAAKHVRQAIHEWLKLGLLKLQYDFNDALFPAQYSFNLRVADFALTIQTTDQRLSEQLLHPFEHLRIPDVGYDHVLQVIELDGLVHVFRNKRSAICCSTDELIPEIKIHIINQILGRNPPNVVFHAACLVQGEKSLLISGRNGAGKTTLALRLEEKGFAYGGDDLAIISPQGNAMGLPFAAGVKSGSWRVLKFHRNLRNSPIYRQPDGRWVRYPRPSHIAPEGARAVGWLVFIRRTPKGPATLKSLDQTDAIRRLIKGCFTLERGLDIVAFNSIKRVVAGARSFELVFSNLDEASDVIVDLCRA